MSDPVLEEAWEAMRMIREAIEEFGPIASLASEDGVIASRGPSLLDEAAEIVEALTRVRSRPVDYSRTIIQRLHDVEVNAMVQSVFEGAWTVKLGDPSNGYLAEGTVGSFGEAEAWLYQKARELIFTNDVVDFLSRLPMTLPPADRTS